MAHLSCSFLNFRYFSTTTYYYNYKLHFLSCPCKNLSYNSRITTSTSRSRRRRKPLHLTFSSKPNLDVISTHEHSDGSVLFRFGDPSEIVENVKLKKFDNMEGEAESSGVMAFDDGDNDIYVLEDGVEIEVEDSSLIEVADEPNTNILSKVQTSVEESEKGLAEEVLEGSKVIELPVAISSVGAKVSATSRSEPVSILSVETKVSPSPDSDFQNNGYAQDILNTELEDSSPAEVSVLDNISEVEDSIPTVESSENDTSDATTLCPVSLKPENNDSKSGSETVVASNVLVDSECEIMDDEVKIETILDGKEGDTSALLSGSPKYEISQDMVQNVVAGSGSEVDIIDILTEFPQFESAINVSAGAEVHTSVDGTEVPNDIVIGESESDTTEIMPVSPQLEREPKLDDGTAEKIQADQFIVKDQSDSDTIQLMPASSQLGAEVKLDNETDDTTTVTTQEDQLMVKDQSESDTVQLKPVASQLERESKLGDETGEATGETNNEDQLIVKDVNETELVELIPLSSQLETESKLDEEMVENIQEDRFIVKDLSGSDTIQLMPLSLQFGADSEFDNEIDDNIVVETQEDLLIVKDQSESDTITLTTVSSQLETDSKIDDETGDGIVVETQEDLLIDKDQSESDTIPLMPVSSQFESGTKIDEETMDIQEDGFIVKDQSESDTIQLKPLSPQSEMEHEFDIETDDDTVVETPEDLLIDKDLSESDTVQSMSLSSQLEAESKLGDETGDATVEKIKEDQLMVKDDSENDLVELIPVSPHLETESKLDEETRIDTLEEPNIDVEVENLTTLKDRPQDLLTETERIAHKDARQVSEILEALENEVIELESTLSATYSEDMVKSAFILSSGAAQLPHPSKVLTGGEDAYFVAGQTWIGLADGVGQWSLEGTKQGVYAQDLIKNCERLVSGCDVNSIHNPTELLKLSVAETHSRGSSTFLIARFDNQTLHVANIGDSGFIVLRHGTVYKRSFPMLHLFQFSIQIEGGEDPSHLAELYEVDLEEGDVIIIATDGLLDNLYDKEISSVVLKSLASDMKLESIAEKLAKRAQEVGASAFSRSPFADSAQAAGYVGYTGGKLDDVTVIVSLVKRNSDL